MTGGFHFAGVPVPADTARDADDGTTVLEDGTDAPVTRLRPPSAPRCKCSHLASQHYLDRRDRPTCGTAACGCIALRLRPKDDQ